MAAPLGAAPSSATVVTPTPEKVDRPEKAALVTETGEKKVENVTKIVKEKTLGEKLDPKAKKTIEEQPGCDWPRVARVVGIAVAIAGILVGGVSLMVYLDLIQIAFNHIPMTQSMGLNSTLVGFGASAVLFLVLAVDQFMTCSRSEGAEKREKPLKPPVKENKEATKKEEKEVKPDSLKETPKEAPKEAPKETPPPEKDGESDEKKN